MPAGLVTEPERVRPQLVTGDFADGVGEPDGLAVERRLSVAVRPDAP
jgi:hypothetical protein